MTENIKDKLNKLVFDFKLSNYRDLNESQTRISYIDRFWELLGWNVRNPLEVQVERTDKSYMGRRPDYRFIKGNKTVFFVEAKKPAEDLTNPRHIYQTKLYCWNGKVPIAILTDFEEFRPFRALGKPIITDSKKGIIKELDMVCDEYPDRVDDLLATFGREAVFAGSLDELVKPTQLELRDTVDKHFLNSLSEWRINLASLIAKKNHFDNEFELAEATQRILDRLVFLRILQDRDIENTDFIKNILEHRVGDSYSAFLMICKELAPKYNGLIFNPHPLSENLTIEASLFKNIVKELNVDDSPYRFDEIPVEVLGTIYERFLGDEISFDKGRKVVIDQKPEVRKAGGVYYTPQYIVEYIVANTVGKLLEQTRTPDDVSRLKILDPACGSGSFLLGAFDALIKWHEDYYSAHPTEIYEKKGKNTYLLAYEDETGKLKLTARKKGRILQNNIYGVDIDKQATEVAQMSLYLKVLEGIAKEPLAVLGFQDALLPKMDDNIKCGNSLIGSDFISDDFFGLSERERHKINPFDWEVAFPFLKVTGGFDAVIGNPPYVQPVYLDINSQQFLYKFYKANTDLYSMFLERSIGLLKLNHRLGFIVPSLFIKGVRYNILREIVNLESKSINLKEYGDGVFNGVKMPTCVLIIEKGKQEARNHFENQKIKFFTKGNVLNLGNISTIRRGLEIGRDKINVSGDVICLNGGSLDRYSIKNVYYISNVTFEAYKKNSSIFESPKILVRETGMHFFANIDYNYAVTNRSVYNVRLTNKEYSIETILAIINSNLFKFYFKQFIAPETNIFPKIRIIQLNEIPIPSIVPPQINTKLVELVERMLRLHKDLQTATEFDRKHIEQYISRTDKEIDALVYQLYALTPEEIRIVEGEG